jgi:hypothetical protein
MDFEKQFAEAKMFDPRDLNGGYRVKMCSGSPIMVYFINLLGDCKIFRHRNDIVSGNNILGGLIRWGHFTVGKARCPVSGLEVVEISYNLGKNLFSRSIRDHIREMASGEYIGKFNLERKDGSLFLAGYFTLKKI